jgi:hypothetical protein
MSHQLVEGTTVAIKTDTQTWEDMKALLDVTVRELQKWRDYEEEVGYDSPNVDRMTDAIDANLALIVSEVK